MYNIWKMDAEWPKGIFFHGDDKFTFSNFHLKANSFLVFSERGRWDYKMKTLVRSGFVFNVINKKERTCEINTQTNK